MKKIIFYIIYYIGMAFLIFSSMGLSILILIKILLPLNFGENLKRWLFMIIFGLLVMIFLEIWNIISEIVIRKRLLKDE